MPNERVIREELSRLKKRQDFLQKQLSIDKDLKKKRLDLAKSLLDTYKSKFAALQTTLSYDKIMERWNFDLPGVRSFYLDSRLDVRGEEDLDKVLNNLEAYMSIKDLLPNFELDGLATKGEETTFSNSDPNSDIQARVGKKENGLFSVKLIKFITDDSYICDLGENLSLEVYSEEDYAEIKFSYYFESTREDLKAKIDEGLETLKKFPSN